MTEDQVDVLTNLANAPQGTGGWLQRLASEAGVTLHALYAYMIAHPRQVSAVLAIVCEFSTGQTAKAIADIRALLISA